MNFYKITISATAYINYTLIQYLIWCLNNLQTFYNNLFSIENQLKDPIILWMRKVHHMFTILNRSTPCIRFICTSHHLIRKRKGGAKGIWIVECLCKIYSQNCDKIYVYIQIIQFTIYTFLKKLSNSLFSYRINKYGQQWCKNMPN